MKLLNESDKKRFARNILLPEIGERGQETLHNSKVLIVGLGGLGSPAAYYLASSGIGMLGLADGDKVDISNLQRQIIHTTGDLDRLKTESAGEKLLGINPALEIRQYNKFMNEETLRNAAVDYDFVVDATDSLPMKQVINQVCVHLKKPFSHGGIHRFGGEAMTVVPQKSACYCCVYPPVSTPIVVPTQPRGPLGPVAGIIGCIQATECLKYLLGMNDLLTDTLLVMDAIRMDFSKIAVRAKIDCQVCGRCVE